MLEQKSKTQQFKNKQDIFRKDGQEPQENNLNILTPEKQWIARHFMFNLETSLSCNQKVKIFRGFRKSSGLDAVLKIILIRKAQLSQYQQILENASQYYSVLQAAQSLMTKAKGITYYLSESNVSKSPNSENQQAYLFIIRQLFKGRNFHQSIFNNSSINYKQEEFHIFIKQSLQVLCSYTAFKQTFIPTLDNLYFHGVGMTANATSFQTILFLKHKLNHLSIQNFKHLYILLSSDVNVLIDWEKMEDYIRQQIKVKAFLAMIFCFMTLRSPIQMIFDAEINDQNLQWDRLLTPQSSHGILRANPSNEVIKLIKDQPRRWKSLLDKPQNKKCFQIYSRKLANPSTHQESQNQQNLSEIHDNYFTELFQRVFVKQEKFGWKELFNQKLLFNYVVIQTSLQFDDSENSLFASQKKNSNFYKEFQRNYAIKRQVAKKAFIYLHKYFVGKDILEMKLTKQDAKKYASQLHFQTYLPIKIGLQLSTTLSQKEWFQVFFIQKEYYQANIYLAANWLYEKVLKESPQMMRLVRSCEFLHIKRILYLLGAKLQQDRIRLQSFSILKKEMEEFVESNRIYQQSLVMFQKKLEQISRKKNCKPQLRQVQQFLMENCLIQTPDLTPLFVAYILKDIQNTEVSLSLDEDLSNIRMDKFVQTNEQMIREMLQKISCKVPLKQRQFFNKIGLDKVSN